MSHLDNLEPMPQTESSVARRRRVRRRRDGWRSADVLRSAAVVMGLYLLGRLIWFAHPLVLTAFLGTLFGLAVAAGVDRLEEFRIPRGLGAALIVVSFFGVLVGFGAWMAPTIHEQGLELRRRLPQAIDRMQDWVDSRRDGLIGILFSGLSSDARVDSAVTTLPLGTDTLSAQPRPAVVGQPTVPAAAPVARPESTTVSDALRQHLGRQVHGATRYLFPFLSSTVEVVTGFVIIIFLSIYIAIDADTYRVGVMHLFPRGRRARIGEVLSAVAMALRKWLLTQLLAMTFMGVITTILLLVLHVKAALALGLISGLLMFIPTAGAIISALPAIAMGFLDSPQKALWVTIAYVGVHFVEGHLLIPLLMKGRVNLPPALTILSQALMAVLFGFLGLMCAVPLLAATMTIVKMLYVEDVVGDPQVERTDDPLPAT
jgi:predicted PurR-regulated permease PerM